jgi:hypothetical protein
MVPIPMATSASSASSFTGLTEPPVTDQGRQRDQSEHSVKITQRLCNKTANIGTVGLGTVGLSLALAYA